MTARNMSFNVPAGGTISFNTDAAVGLILAVYLVIVLYQGNLGNFAASLKRDFLGEGNQPPFWRWAVAVLILAALANGSKTRAAFGPILGFSLVAMLIYMAEKRPEGIRNLVSGLETLFGFGPPSAPGQDATARQQGAAGQPYLAIAPNNPASTGPLPAAISGPATQPPPLYPATMPAGAP